MKENLKKEKEEEKKKNEEKDFKWIRDSFFLSSEK